MRPGCADPPPEGLRLKVLRLLFATGFAMLVVTSLRGAALGGAPSCDDLETVDFRNTSLRLQSRGTVTFVDGVGFSSDAGEDGQSKDWRISVVQDTPLRPSPGVVLRLIRFSASHVTGSGEWDHVTIYACKEGRLAEVFDERYLYGVEVRIVNDGVLRFVHSDWKGKDAMCRPSNQVVSTYRWDKGRKSFSLIDNAVRRRQNFD